MNTEQLLPLLEAELKRILCDENLRLVKFEKINTIKNSDLLLLGKAFAEGKYKGLSSENYLGFNPVRITLIRNGVIEILEIVVKGHPPGMFTENIYPQMLEKCKIHVSQSISDTFIHREFQHLYANEYYFYEIQHQYPIYAKYCPRYYGRYWDKDTNETFVFIELINGMSHLNDLNGVGSWDESLYKAALEGICDLHLPFYDNKELFTTLGHEIVGPFNYQDFNNSSELWEKLAFTFKKYIPDLIDDKFYQKHLSIISDIPTWHKAIDNFPKTIIHSDYNPRNIGFRKLFNQWSVVVLDWECIRWDLPQYDLAQFLLYTGNPTNIVEISCKYIEFSRQYFEKISGLELNKVDWLIGFQSAVKSHLIDRAPLMGLVFEVFPGSEVNIGVLMYQNAKKLVQSWM